MDIVKPYYELTELEISSLVLANEIPVFYMQRGYSETGRIDEWLMEHGFLKIENNVVVPSRHFLVKAYDSDIYLATAYFYG